MSYKLVGARLNYKAYHPVHHVPYEHRRIIVKNKGIFSVKVNKYMRKHFELNILKMRLALDDVLMGKFNFQLSETRNKIYSILHPGFNLVSL